MANIDAGARRNVASQFLLVDDCHLVSDLSCRSADANFRR